MAQGHRFKSEWRPRLCRSHSGRFGAVRQGVAEWSLFAHSCRRLTAARRVDSASSLDVSPDVASRVDQSWPKVVGQR